MQLLFIAVALWTTLAPRVAVMSAACSRRSTWPRTSARGAEVVSVLKGVSLALARGEIVALEGPSGSGKTTLLSILGCILTAASGRVVVDGEEVAAGSARPSAGDPQASIGFVFQQFNLFPSLTALENVEYALNVKGAKGARRAARPSACSTPSGSRTARDFLPRDLSGGQKQRVAIARALAGNSPILLADEPTANLDSQIGGQVLELFRALAKKEDRALLIVTHDPKVRTVADRVLQIRDGLLAADGLAA